MPLFGSNEVFEMIREALENEKRSDWYNELYQIVEENAQRILHSEYRLKSFLSEEDKEEVAQDVALKVYQNLVDFYMTSQAQSYSEAQRGSWFKTIVEHAAEDYIRKHKKKIILPLDKKTDGDGDDDSVAFIEILTDEIDVSNQAEDILYLLYAIKCICLLPTSAQNLIAFLFGTIDVAFSSGRSSISAQNVIKNLNGLTLFEAFDLLKELLDKIFDEPIPKDTLSPLLEKLKETDKDGKLVGDHVMDLTTKQITNATNWFRSKIKRLFADYINSDQPDDPDDEAGGKKAGSKKTGKKKADGKKADDKKPDGKKPDGDDKE